MVRDGGSSHLHGELSGELVPLLQRHRLALELDCEGPQRGRPQVGDAQQRVVEHLGIDDEHVGAWFLHARGSGIWVHTGRTIAFGDHAEAWEAFGVGHLDLKARNEAMCANASAADSASHQGDGTGKLR